MVVVGIFNVGKAKVYCQQLGLLIQKYMKNRLVSIWIFLSSFGFLAFYLVLGFYGFLSICTG